MISIEKMQAEDVEAVSQIETECFSQPWSKQSLSEALQQNSMFLVARDSEDVIGYCGMYVSFDEGEITNVAVRKEHRGAHIATKLMEKLLIEAENQKLQRILLEVRISNTAAISLYEKMGFQTLCVCKGFYSFPKEDAFLMQKTLEL